MTENEIMAQVQVLHTLIVQNYDRETWCLLPDVKNGDRKAMTKLQIELSDVFGNTKDERTARLETLVAILPILQHDGKPIMLESTKNLLIAELYGLLSWLEANGAAIKTLKTIRRDPNGWAQRIRDHLGYINRPVMSLAPSPIEEEPLPLFAEVG